MQDLRDEFKDVQWQQGVLLSTQTVMRMPEEWRAEMRAKEKCALFAHFSPFDEGRSRVCLWRFATPEECAAAVAQHNKELAERLKTPNAKVSGAGTASAGLLGYAAGGNGERK